MKELTNKDGTVFYESEGVVKSFNEETGYGFIFSIDEPDNDIYFHFSEVLLENKKDLKIGNKVEFIYRKHDKGLRAYSIKRKQETKE
ncbi:MAG: cold shock domain-containing protein [Bacteriovoracaceae bacterium]